MDSPARPSARPFLVTAVSCVALVLLAIGLADRPFSTWSHAEFHGDQGVIWLSWIVDPTPPLAVAGLIGAGIVAGWRPGAKGRVLLAVCLATVAALVVKDQLKILFGRTWPETWTNNHPSWAGNGTFGFEPLDGGAGWFSFPSGHTTLITAPHDGPVAVRSHWGNPSCRWRCTRRAVVRRASQSLPGDLRAPW